MLDSAASFLRIAEMERRSFLAALNTCTLCGQPLDKGNHWMPLEREDGTHYVCLVPFAVTPESVPRVDVLSGTGTIRTTDETP